MLFRDTAHSTVSLYAETLTYYIVFSSKIIYVCKIGTYNADSHLIYLVEIKPQKESVYSVSSIRRQSRKYPQKSNPNQIKPHPNVHKNVCVFNGFPSYHMAKVWSSYQTEDLYCIMYRIGVWCLTTLSTISRSYRGGQLHCWRGKPEYQEKTTDVIYSQWPIWLFIWNLQYSHGHTMINHCDKHITPPIDTDISFGMVSLFTDFDMPFGR